MSPSSSHCCSVVVAVVSLWCLRCHIVTVLSSLLWCRLHVGHGFVVAVAVLPLSSHCHGFVIVTLSRCCRHGFVVAIVVSPSLSHCRGVVVAVVLLQCLCCRIVAVSSLPSPCRLHRH